MRILFVTSLLGKEFGGAEVSMSLLLDSLVAEGHQVQALTTRKVKADPRLISVSFPVEVPKKLLTVGNGWVDYFLARKIRRQLEALKPGVIHIQDTYILPATVAANRSLRIPCVATIRNNVLDKAWELMFPKPFSTMLKRRNKTIVKALGEVDCVVSVSQYIKEELVTRGVAAEKIVPIYNLPPTFSGANTQTPQSSDGKIHLFAPGFLASFKGFTTLISAMRQIADEQPNVDLTIAGDGPQRKALERMTAKLRLQSNVKFVGKVPFAKLSPFYTASDIVVFPSIFPEPFGRVALEAMYFGKTVVASKVGGIPEVVQDGESGLLFSPDSPKEVARAVLTLARDAKLRDALGKEGKRTVDQRFGSKGILDQHQQVYEMLIKNRQENLKCTFFDGLAVG